MPADAIPLSRIRRVLVTKLRHHGDVLLASPVFTALKAAAPQAQIDGLVYADTAEMLSGHSDLDQLHVIDRAWKRLGLMGQAKAEWSLLKTLQSRQYDLIVHLTEHPRGAWLSRLLKPNYAVAPRVNGRGRFWKGSFTHFVAPIMGSGRRHVVEQHLDALRRIGIQPAPDQRALTFVPVYLSQSNKVSQVATEIQKFGRLAGTEKIAQPVADRFKKRLAKLQQIYGSRPTVTVFYQISESPLMTIGGNQIISNALDICGGKNVFNALTPMASVVSVESVLAANPEAIMASGMEQTNPTTFDQWKKWSKLTATQNNNFFLVDPDLMNRNGPRILDGTQMLCEAIQIARNRRLSQAGNHQN